MSEEEITYYIEKKKVTKEDYEAFLGQLGPTKLWQCKKMKGGGQSTDYATHKTTNKKYFVISTTKNEKHTNEIKLTDQDFGDDE